MDDHGSYVKCPKCGYKQVTYAEKDVTPLKNVPVTSIRRALTNLSNSGQISKTGQVQGHYRRPINTYRYGGISHV